MRKFCGKKGFNMQEQFDFLLKKIEALEKRVERYYSLLKINNELDFVLKGTYLIEEDIEKTIRNLGSIGSKGMKDTDSMILEIMVCK